MFQGPRLFPSILCLIIALGTVAAIWTPVLRHYHVVNYPIKSAMVEAARLQPADAALEGLRDLTREGSWWAAEDIVPIAEGVLKGRFSMPGEVREPITMPFAANDLDEGSPARQLFLASLAVPRILTEAYKITGRDEFLITARDVILAWASFERNQVLPRSLLWNDHAIARRIRVLTQFWRHYRNHRDYDSETGRIILEFAGRNAAFLAKPSQFTVASNHGIMQNLGLWHAVLAFPTLPEMDNYRSLAFDRLKGQLEFFVNDEGVILEHSAGYHWFGLRLMYSAFKYLELLDIDTPPSWMHKYKGALKFFIQLRRPDGTLPMFGDTSAGRIGSISHFRKLASVAPFDDFANESKSMREEPQPGSLYPVAGYSIWWDGLDHWPRLGSLSQTVVAWSNYPELGHKHADELSVLLWAGGRNWLTNMGYVGYGTEDRTHAESWEGSNAPHVIGESIADSRRSHVKSYGTSDTAAGIDLAAIDLERVASSGFRARRQVVHLSPGLWVVVDRVSGGSEKSSRTIWTSGSDMTMTVAPELDSYTLAPAFGGEATTLDVKILGGPGTTSQPFRASREPFAGWVELGYELHPAPAIVVEQSAEDSWVVSLWSLRSNDAGGYLDVDQASMTRWNGPESWEVRIPIAGNGEAVSLARNGNVLAWTGSVSSPARMLQLEQPPDARSSIARIEGALQRNIARYPSRIRINLGLREKLTYLLFFLFVLQELFFFLYARRVDHGYLTLRYFAAAGWAICSIWLVQFYL